MSKIVICKNCGKPFEDKLERANRTFCSKRCSSMYYNDRAKKPESYRNPDCTYNIGVECAGKRNCWSCGWNPVVEAARKAEIYRKHCGDECKTAGI